MTAPHIRLLLPDGRRVALGPDAIVGRSRAATLRLDDPRVSTVHAELSWREAGPCLLARGGRLIVGGRAQAELPLAPGLRFGLAPGLEFLVEDVIEGPVDPTPPTLGRQGLRWRCSACAVELWMPGEAEPVSFHGVPGRLLAACLDREAPAPWAEVAGELWPEDARIREGLAGGTRWTEPDEARLRNRWDQVLRQLRQQLAQRGLEDRLRTGGGTIQLLRPPADRVERA